MEKLTLASPVRAIPGIGESRAAAFGRLGVFCVRDLLLLFPRAYENRGAVRRLVDGEYETRCAFILTVATAPRSAMIRRGMTVTRFRAFDESGSCEVVFFNQAYVKDIFCVGTQFRFFGKLTKTRNGISLTSPAYEAVVPNEPLPAFVAKYPLSEGLSGKIIEKAVDAALRAVLPCLADHLPEDIRQKYEFPTLAYALMTVHHPQNETALSAALRRMVFDELYCFCLGMAQAKGRRTWETAPVCPPVDLTPLLSCLPYRLTAAQERVIQEIREDMTGGDRPPMNRILVGDVGSGKTVCAACAIYTAVRAGRQAALMVPTEILARQHYADLAPLLGGLGVRVELLLGATTEKEKKRIRTACAAGEADLIIGTHALLSDKLQFSALGLTVTDEQHRFGVRQRAALKDKQKGSHLLVMSATPIPRTLALTIYGDLEISKIDELPPGRQKVSTFVVDESYRDRLNGFIRKQVEEGGQVYIVCPAVDEAEEDENNKNDLSLDRLDLFTVQEEHPPLKAATSYAKELKEQVFPDLRIDFLHGKMRSVEKDAVMRRFADGETQILVSTTVIEVGVNVPRATLMIVENAERFGLSQLHQLRGRVGRGTQKSYCILVSDARGEQARARLDVMHRTYDGYTIAEKDLEQRGPGDFFAGACSAGYRQSGGMDLHLAYLCNDTALMQAAAEEARATANADPQLMHPRNIPARAEVERLFAARDVMLS